MDAAGAFAKQDATARPRKETKIHESSFLLVASWGNLPFLTQKIGCWTQKSPPPPPPKDPFRLEVPAFSNLRLVRRGAERGRKGPKGAERGRKGPKGAERGRKGPKGAERGRKGPKGAERGRKGEGDLLGLERISSQDEALGQACLCRPRGL